MGVCEYTHQVHEQLVQRIALPGCSFDSDTQVSFGSIFKSINQNSTIENGADRWTLILPPDQAIVRISLAGYTGEGLKKTMYLFVKLGQFLVLRHLTLVLFISHTLMTIYC